MILHEYGHAIHFSQNFSFASEEAGAISEGFGDYWAVTVSDVVGRSLGVANKEPLPCVADWDSTSYTSDRAALPAARRHEPALPGGPERRGAPRRPDLVARAVGHPPGARQRQGRHGHPARVVRLPRHDDDRRSRTAPSRPRSSSTARARRTPSRRRSPTAASSRPRTGARRLRGVGHPRSAGVPKILLQDD